jgi:aminoglycoside/choline kinase family phosphotransferase
LRWLDGAIDARWSGARAGRVAMLKGDASNRRFWRIQMALRPNGAPASAIAIDLGPDDLPAYVRTLNLLPEPPTEPPFLNVQRFLKSIGSAVPEIYAAAPQHRMLLVEDVGETSLFDAALERIDKPAALYRGAADELLLIHVEGTRRLDSRCIAASIAYDERLFRWEMDQFLDAGSQWLGTGADLRGLAPELDDLAARLGRLPRVLSHRDYHGHNLFVQNGRVRVIDFQDALLAPAAQDLAVLLTTRDTDRVIDPAGEFRESYRLCVLQHALKVIGRFSYFESQGKTGYAAFIPHAAGQARRMLEQHREYPRLRSAFGVS